MFVRSYLRGGEIYYDGKSWRYLDNDKIIDNNERTCKRCGRIPTEERYDACLGYIDGIKSACCGHGIEQPYTIPYNTNIDSTNNISKPKRGLRRYSNIQEQRMNGEYR